MRPGRLKIFYQQETGRGHGVWVGSIQGRPHWVLLHYSWRSFQSALVWSWWEQRAQREGCYLLLPAFSRFPLQHGEPLSSRDGRGWASHLHLLGECLGSEQELPQSWRPGALLGAGLVVPHSQPAAFNKELITLPSTCVRLLETSTWVFPGPAAPRVARCIHPMPVAAPAQSGCLRGGPWRLLSLGRRTWCTKGGPLSEAEVLRLRPSGPVRRPESSIPARASRSSRSPTAAWAGRPRSVSALAGKMPPVSAEVKTSPLQKANFCSRLFVWWAPHLSGDNSCKHMPDTGGFCWGPRDKEGALGTGGSRGGRRTQGPGVHLIQLPQNRSAIHGQFWKKLQLSPQGSSLWTTFFI